MPYPVQIMIQILLMLKIFLIRDSEIQGLLYGAVFRNPAFFFYISGPGCSKLTMSLVNEMYKFQNVNISSMPNIFC